MHFHRALKGSKGTLLHHRLVSVARFSLDLEPSNTIKEVKEKAHEPFGSSATIVCKGDGGIADGFVYAVANGEWHPKATRWY